MRLDRPPPGWHPLFVDETYVKVSGTWRYIYRAIDQYGQVIDVFMRPQGRHGVLHLGDHRLTMVCQWRSPRGRGPTPWYV